MESTKATNFRHITAVVEYIRENSRAQSLPDEAARRMGCSLTDLERMFTEWGNIGFEQFMKYIGPSYTRKVLNEQGNSLFDTVDGLGLPEVAEVHELPVRIEGMTPDECVNGGRKLLIRYDFAETLFGPVLVASTEKGVCYLGFADDREGAQSELKRLFPRAEYVRESDEQQRRVLALFTRDRSGTEPIVLHLKGTAFQLKVWNALLQIPCGALTTYGAIARYIGNPGAARAVGTAVGDNPVSVLVPCHRVIQSGGAIGGYHWGPVRKTVIIGWEGAVVKH